MEKSRIFFNFPLNRCEIFRPIPCIREQISWTGCDRVAHLSNGYSAIIFVDINKILKRVYDSNTKIWMGY